MENIIKTYPNGLRTVVRPMPGFNSVSSRVQVNVVSIDEAENEHGLSHFLEHLMFYTKSRSAKELRNEIDDCGARINGCTYKSRTVYYTHGLDFNFDKCNEILADMFFNTNITEENLEKEKQIVVQEIEGNTKPDNERSPNALMYEYFYSGTPYEHKTGGTVEGVQSYSVQDVVNFKKKHYVAPNIILGFAGNISPERVDKMVNELWLPYLDKTPAEPNYAIIDDKKMIIPKRKFIHVEKDVPQHRVSISIPSFNMYSQDFYHLNMVTCLLG